jgi:anthranilate synthase/aminodeoxychorismate synthase-like glutamine amidotransferase
MILLLDNVDSFVHNLERYLVRLGQATRVVRAGTVSADEIKAWRPDALVFSPGPCRPSENSAAVAIIREFWQTVPMLGVCLGHQQIIFALGGQIEPAPMPVHGRDSAIHHDGRREFSLLPNPFPAARYHSLVSPGDVPDALEVSATADEDVVMAVRAREFPVFGWQFHPESILTPHGFDLLRGFLRASNLTATQATPCPERPLPSDAESHRGNPHHSHPITF